MDRRTQNMNMKRLFIFAALLASITFTALAQQSIISQQRHAIDEAITLLDNYSTYAVVDNEEEYYEFLDLFANDSVMVYNDLLGLSFNNNIPAIKYVQLLSNGLKNKRAIVKNIKSESVLMQDNDKWQIKLSFDKSLRYLDRCGIYLSSSEFYDNHDYRLTATFEYDPSSNICKITGIDGTIDSQKKLNERFFAFLKTDPRDDKLLYNGQPLQFNTYDQVLLQGSRDPEVLKHTFVYDDPDIVLKPQTSDCQVTMKYKARRFRLRPHIDIGLSKVFIYEGDDVFTDSKSQGVSYGLDLGIALVSKRSYAIVLFTGVGLCQSTMDFSFVQSDYSFLSNGDLDGDSYNRHYRNLKLNQKLKISELTIPLYFDFNFKLSKSLSLFFDLGARYDMNMSSKIDSFDGRADVYGVYPKYGNLTLDEHWPYNGFGYHQFDSSDLLSSDLLDVQKNNINGIGSFGVRNNLPNIPLSIELGANYVMGLNNLIETSNVIDPSNSPVVYNTLSGTVNSEHVHNLSEMLKSVKRKQLNVSLGVILKL